MIQPSCVRPLLIATFSVLVATAGCVSTNGETASNFDPITARDNSVNVTGAVRRPINAEDMYSLTNLGGMHPEGLSVSPDGKYVAFQMHRASVERNEYDVAWYVLDLTGKVKAPVRIGIAGDPLLFRWELFRGPNGAWKSTNPVWSPDSQWVAYRRMDGDSVQVWRSSPDGSIREKLTDSQANVDAFSWSEDGTEIIFETDVLPEERAAALEAKWDGGLWAEQEGFLPGKSTYHLLPYETNGGRPTFESSGGRPKLWIQNVSSGKVRAANEVEVEQYYAINVTKLAPAGQSMIRNTRVPGRPQSSDVVTAPNGVSIAWLLNTTSPDEFRRLYVRMGHTEGEDIACELDECSRGVSGLWWSRDSREVIFERRDWEHYGRNIFYGWDAAQNTVRRIHTEQNSRLTACSSTGVSLICFSDEAERPRALVEFQFADGRLREIYDPNPQFGQIAVGEAELITWPDGDGDMSIGWLVKPIRYEKGMRYPLVIIQYNKDHCFKGGTGDEYPAHLFAVEGFAVLCMSQPGSIPNENGERPLPWDKSHFLLSWEGVIDLLDEQGLIDASRVGITGLSAGVDAVTFSLHRTERFSAAALSGMSWGGPIAYFYGGAQYRKWLRDWGLGRFGTEDDKYWKEIIPGLNADKVNTPILVQVSDEEAIGTRFNYVTLKEEGKPIDMYIFRDEHHIKWHPRNKKAVAVRAVDWMRFWLKGEEDPDPAKAEQYERWREMRSERCVRENVKATADCPAN